MYAQMFLSRRLLVGIGDDFSEGYCLGNVAMK
jgi:hypothetical protein